MAFYIYILQQEKAGGVVLIVPSPPLHTLPSPPPLTYHRLSHIDYFRTSGWQIFGQHYLCEFLENRIKYLENGVFR